MPLSCAALCLRVLVPDISHASANTVNTYIYEPIWVQADQVLIYQAKCSSEKST